MGEKQIQWFVFILFAFVVKLHGVHFTIVIPSYNNEQYCQWNLESALNQKYDDYDIIYINDCSTDKTEKKVRKIIDSHPKGHLVKLVNRVKNLGALENIYRAVHQFALDDAVIVLLDGDDGLAHRYVLLKLNKEYSNSDIWLTFGQFREKKSGKRGWVVPVPQSVARSNKMRQFPVVPSHLRTFKAWLFKRIHEDDLKYEGEFYSMSWDLAIMLPMIEMAAEGHYLFINQILYIYNDQNPISDHQKDRLLQMKLDKHVRMRPRYFPLRDQ